MANFYFFNLVWLPFPKGKTRSQPTRPNRDANVPASRQADI